MSVSTVRDTVAAGAIEIDRAPVTNARYAEFVAATRHRAPTGWPNGHCPGSLLDHPVVGVDFFDALAFAIWSGGCLPTEMEWVLASGLDEPRAFPWGDEFDKQRCNTVRSGHKATTPVGTYPPAPSGCVDLVGNVWEMTCHAYPDDDEAIIVKGGSWYDYPCHSKLDTQFSAHVNRPSPTVGFRLVYGRPMRLPEFLNEDLAWACIDYRRRDPAGSAAPETDPAEFLDVVSALREKAEAELPGLESPDVDIAAVDEALDAFDALEFEPFSDWPAEPAPEPSTATIGERTEAMITRRPLRLLAVAGALAALLVVWTVSADGNGAHSDRGVSTVPAGVPERTLRRAGRTPVRIARTDPAGAERQAFRRLLEGTPAQRDESERFLIAHPERARALIEDALREAPEQPAVVMASLRYVLASIADKEPGPAVRPAPTRLPPREGLVFFFASMNAEVGDEIGRVRRTAKAEGVPFTLVFSGEASARLLARTYESVIRDAKLYVDRDRTLTQLWNVSRMPAVAGITPGGGLAFLQEGFADRSVLAANVARLRARS